MRVLYTLILISGLSCYSSWSLSGQIIKQTAVQCEDITGKESVPTSAFFNYGSGINMRSSSKAMDLTIGEMVVGTAWNTEQTGEFGYWGQFLVPPFMPLVTASQGELLDRIQVNWTLNPLGAFPSDGFKLYRDGVFLALLDKKTLNFNDFNVIAGRPYHYEVRGINTYGEGSSGKAIGFQVPNGVVTGYVQTLNGSPVPNAMVALLPMQGFSAAFDETAGAFAMADTLESGDTTFLPESTSEDWTMTFWIKTETAAAGAAIIGLEPFPLFVQASAIGDEGVGVGTTANGAPFLSGAFDAGTENNWHHVAFVSNSNAGQARLYIDAKLVDLAEMVLPLPKAEVLNIGARTGAPGWKGRLDELRIYHRCLDELDLGEAMMGTASSLTEGLKYYWKMDEELGTGSFDVIRRNKLYFCGAGFDADKPHVRTMGITDAEGFYRIESVSYGTGTTFQAEPMKNFYKHRSIQFVRSEEDKALLPNFSLTDKATLELWVNNTRPIGTQCLLSKKWQGNDFRLQLEGNGTNNTIVLVHNGTSTTLGNLDMDYQHLALTIDNTSGAVALYKGGNAIGTASLSGAGNWSDDNVGTKWVLGARELGSDYTDFYDGLIDELAIYDEVLDLAAIQNHVLNSRNPQEKGLRIYFPMDEGNGNRLTNVGSVLLDSVGMTEGTQWTPFSPNQMTTPHEFIPKTRQVTLNPSVTSVDQVDFVDQSTVAVSGFVRYQNTDCFANSVEILVNGETYNPPIFTDSTGRFLIDFDPGTTAILTPKFEDHNFLPASWELTNVVSPIAGILFNDVTTRMISGEIVGGSKKDCRKSIISDVPNFEQYCEITVSTADGCYERSLLLKNEDGQYTFDNLPPLEVTIAITRHDNFPIYQDFQTQGGRTIDLSLKDSTGVNFVYIAPPNVGVENYEGFEEELCPDPSDPTKNLIVLKAMEDQVKLDITVYEQYGIGQDMGDRCYLDEADLRIDNTFDMLYDFSKPLLETLVNGTFRYEFYAGNPNPFPPYLQTMQITADVGGKKGTYSRKALIEGVIKGTEKFTTQLPTMPNFVLRDPPGDGSYAFIEKGTTFCNSMSFHDSDGEGPVFLAQIQAGAKTIATLPTGGPAFLLNVVNHSNENFNASFIVSQDTSMKYCVTTTERISTDDGDLVVGGSSSFDGGKTILAGNDVYIGTAFNIKFSDSREIIFGPDPLNPIDPTGPCDVRLKATTTAEPDTFATTYMYSEFNIENNVIRYLDSLIVNGDDPVDPTDPTGKGRNTKSKEMWLNFIAANKAAKDAAIKTRNISFDAGVQYEYSEAYDTTLTWSTEDGEALSGGFFKQFGTEIGGTGSFLQVGANFESDYFDGTGRDTTRTWTTGYVLKDDDPGDNWTVDIGQDGMFKTPVFNIVAGQTSCPWEVGTSPREGVKLISVDGNTRLDVPSNGIAAFKFQLNNNSPTGETFTYSFTAGPESNPDGAIIKLNGAPLDHNVYYAIPWGESVPVTVTVERGPTAYSYQDMEVVLFSECHDMRSNALGFAPDFDPTLYSAVYLNVDFIEPCSEVDIAFPFDGWLVKQGDETVPINIYDYDTSDDDLLGIRLQYRPADGNGAWINIPLPQYSPLDYIPKSALVTSFKQVNWNTASPMLADGPYEIRALTVCSGGPDAYPGISHVIPGYIDRQPPSLLSVPEPSDGVFQVGDEISFTFNQEINCDDLIVADQTQPNNVGLYDATTGQLIDANMTCFENKIILDPNFQNKFFENRILRAELHNIEDLSGNNLIFEKWEFYVDRNELAWLTDSIGMTKYEDNTQTVIAKIHNRGGYPVPFSIIDLPPWVRVVPDKGTIVANEIREIRFEVDSTLAFGHWTDSITLHTETGQNPFFMGGDERLPLGVRVVCRPPNWNMNAGLYENTMNMVLKLDIQGELSTDPEDIVAAYIDDELRGRSKLEYVPLLDDYFVYLTIYGSPDDMDKPVRLEVWDASACLRYGLVQENYTFEAEKVIGTSSNPETIHTNSLVLREVPLGYGWNWISFNLEFPDNSLNAALASLKHPTNGFIRAQTPFSVYDGTSWQGALTNLGNTEMYVYRTDQPDTLKMLGNLIDPLTTDIPVVAGWNWIGYIPNYALPIDAALASLSAVPDDLIKSQVAFAQYTKFELAPGIFDYKWIGNLKYMSPPNGYQIKLASPGTLSYPANPNPFADGGVAARGPSEQPISSYWSVNPSQYEFGTTLIGALEANGENVTTSTMELGAFAGGEVRGAAQAIYIQSIDAYQFFLTSYANTNGEQLHYKLYDAETGNVQDLAETRYFSADQHQGTINDPVPFSLPVNGTTAAAFQPSFKIGPNPFSTETSFRFRLPAAQDVSLIITDVNGREVSSVYTQAAQGLNILTWNGHSGSGERLSAGVYFVRLVTEQGSVTRKVVLQR